MELLLRLGLIMPILLLARGVAAEDPGPSGFREDPERGGAARQRAYFARLYAPFDDGLPREYLDRTWKEIQSLPSEEHEGTNLSLGW